MRPIRIVLCLALLGLLALPASSLALTVGNPSKNGSLLVFPLIDVSDNTDTVVAITNSYYSAVKLACYYHSLSHEVDGAVIPLSANQTVWFSLKTGDGSMKSPFDISGTGEMKCWAVNDLGNRQISWNYLQGFAEITHNQSDTWGYSSWNFAADRPLGEAVGEPGVIKLSGLPGGYDAMPRYLQFGVPGTVDLATITLVLGKEDVTQDRENIYSKAKFSYARGGTSSTKCINNEAQTTISAALLGSFRVYGIASTVCDTAFGLPKNTTQDSPLLGVLKARSKLSGAVFGIMPSGVGADGSGYILWDPDTGVEEKSMR